MRGYDVPYAQQEASQALALQARSPHTDASRLHELAARVEDWLRAAVAANPHAPEHLLRNLADDECEYVRAAAARNLTAEHARHRAGVPLRPTT